MTAYQHFEQLDFKNTRQAIYQNPPSLAHIYLNNLNDCAELILNESPDQYTLFETQFQARLKQLDEFPASVLKGFVASEIRLQWAFTAIKYKHNWQAFWLMRRANRIIDKNLKAEPQHPLYLRSSGLLNIVLDLVPDNNKWLLNFFGMSGDFELGYRQIEKSLIIDDKKWQSEAQLIKLLIDSYLLELDSNQPPLGQAPLYQYVSGLLYNKQHKASEAISAFKNLPHHIAVRPYLMAEAYFNNGDYKMAIPHYQEYLQNELAKNYKKDTQLKLGLAKWFISEKRMDGQSYFDLAANIENEETEVDRNAANLLTQLNDMPLELLKLRFALDGGNYTKAKTLINSIEQLTLSPYQQLEFLYRKARYFQLINDLELAIDYYSKVIEQGANFEEVYFVPYSFLQLGKVMMERKQNEEAIIYLEKVLAFKDYSYKQSLDIKAKIALKSLDRPND